MTTKLSIDKEKKSLSRRQFLNTTSVNGKEFASHESVADALRIRVYFADPYRAWQRGLNENTMGALRTLYNVIILSIA